MNKQDLALLFILLAGVPAMLAQDAASPEGPGASPQARREALKLTRDGYNSYLENRPIEAEATFRKAQSIDPELVPPAFNLGTTQFREESYGEAFGNFKQAAEAARTRSERHQAYHNMGNVFMERKEYEKAVGAYKEALKNNPNDDETRYNYALAKEMLKNNPPENQDQNQDQNKDQNSDSDQNNDGQGNQDNKDDQKGDQGSEGDQGDQKDNGKQDPNQEGDQEGDGQQKDQEGQDGSENPQEQNQSSEQQGDKQDPKQQSDNPQQARPRQDQLSRQNLLNLLEALENEEKKVQEKVQAKKVKGTPIKTNKDW